MSALGDKLAAAVADFFVRNDWPVEPFDDDGIVPGVLVTSVKGASGSWAMVVAIVGDAPTHLVVQSIVELSAPEGDEVPTIELLTRLNDGLLDGCFELDFDDGTIRLRSSLPIGWAASADHETLVAMVDEVVTNNAIVADHFMPAISAVIVDGLAPGLSARTVVEG